MLLFLVPADSQDIASDYQVLLGELRKYNPELLDKRRLLAVSKSDLLDAELTRELDAELQNSLPGVPYLFISSVSGQGLTQLKDQLWKLLNE